MNLGLRFPDGRRVPIRIGHGLLAQAGPVLKRAVAPSLAVVVVDGGLPRQHREAVMASLKSAGIRAVALSFPPGEGAKTLSQLEHLARSCVRAGLRRNGVVVALGGGVAGDLAGFLAAVYMRGVSLLQLPTTLLAQVDAGIGGKCAVDLVEGKNLLGAFHQPVAVLCDLNALASLSEHHYREGFAEVVKCAMLQGSAAFRMLERDAGALGRRDPAALHRAVGMAVRLKAGLVSRDERETHGLREHLNLGHTLGHAAEAVAGYRGLSHGDAVAAGMVAAVEVSRHLGVLKDAKLPERMGSLLEHLGLPDAFPARLDRARILEAARRDKKMKSAHVRMVLPVDLGRVVSREVPLAVLRGAL